MVIKTLLNAWSIDMKTFLLKSNIKLRQMTKHTKLINNLRLKLLSENWCLVIKIQLDFVSFYVLL